MCVCLYVYVCVSVCMCMYVCLSVCVCMCVYVRMYGCMYVHMYVRMYVCMRKCMCLENPPIWQSLTRTSRVHILACPFETLHYIGYS